MSDEKALAERDGDRELLALIAEWRMLMKCREELFDEAKRRDNEICSKSPPPQVAIGRWIGRDGPKEPIQAKSEIEIDRWFDKCTTQFAVSIVRAFLEMKRATEVMPQFELYRDCREELVAELRAQIAVIEEAKEAAGIAELYERADDINNQADAIFDRIKNAEPATIHGAVAILDLYNEVDDEDLIAPIATFLRAIARRAG